MKNLYSCLTLAWLLLWSALGCAQTCAPVTTKLQYEKTSCPLLTPSFAACDDLNQFVEAQRTGATTEHINNGTVTLNSCDMNLSSPANDPGNILYLTSPERFVGSLALFGALKSTSKQYADAWAGWEAARLDQQLGGSTTSTGSSSLVAKPGTAGLLAMAVESGSFTQTNNGTSTTLTANLGGLTQFLTSGNPIKPACSGNCNDWLQNMGIDATFTLAQTGSATTSSSGPANASTPATISSVLVPTSAAKFSALDVTYNFFSVNPGSAKFKAAYDKAVNDSATNAANQYTNAVANLVNATVNNTVKGACKDLPDTSPMDEYQSLFDKFRVLFLADARLPDPKQAVRAIARDYDLYVQQYVALTSCADSADFASLVTSASEAISSWAVINQGFINKARGTPLVALKYTYSRPASQPDTHSVQIIVTASFKSNAFTFNGAGSLYGVGRPSTANYGRLHDAQLSAELDHPFGPQASPTVVLSVAGYGQYQPDASVLNITNSNLLPGTNISIPTNGSQVLVGTAGWLGVVQGKAVINLPKSISIPLAIKWSNKTDLLQANDVRGQIGLSYDFSSLTSAFSKQ